MNGQNSSVFRKSSTVKELPASSLAIYASKPITKRVRRITLQRAMLLLLAILLGLEMKSSWLESHVLASIATRLTFSLENGATDAIQYSSAGPYDKRLGYSRLPKFLARLKASGFQLESQARESKMYSYLGKLHIYP